VVGFPGIALETYNKKKNRNVLM